MTAQGEDHCICGDESCRIYGLCHCGCGRPTHIADRTRKWNTQHGTLQQVKGRMTLFAPHHRYKRTAVALDKDGKFVIHRRDLRRICSLITVGDECWYWRGLCQPNGYGRCFIFNSVLPAHRFVYQWLIGPIPDGLDLDHMCHNRDISCAGGPECAHRRCVNPSHLEPATRLDNLRRGRATKAKCGCGEVFTTLASGRKTCLPCNRKRDKDRGPAKRLRAKERRRGDLAAAKARSGR